MPSVRTLAAPDRWGNRPAVIARLEAIRGGVQAGVRIADETSRASIVAVTTVIVAFLMVSTIPTWSGKKIGARVPREQVVPMIVAVVMLIAFLVSWPFPFLAIATIAYLACIPLGWHAFRRLNRAHEAAEAAAAASREDEDAGIVAS